jgi:hypothetical protein
VRSQTTVLVLLLLLLTSCGQPLQRLPTRQPTRPAGAQPTRPAPASPAPSAIPGTPQPTVVASPTAPALPTTAVPSPTQKVVVVPQTATPQSGEQRWRAQQLQRQAFETPRLYVAQHPVSLLWFDPATGQSLEIGTLRGEFSAQAQFLLRDGSRPALEVPYQINVSYGLTAISDALRERMRAAGYAESVEAYVLQADDILPKS